MAWIAQFLTLRLPQFNTAGKNFHHFELSIFTLFAAATEPERRALVSV